VVRPGGELLCPVGDGVAMFAITVQRYSTAAKKISTATVLGMRATTVMGTDRRRRRQLPEVANTDQTDDDRTAWGMCAIRALGRATWMVMVTGTAMDRQLRRYPQPGPGGCRSGRRG